MGIRQRTAMSMVRMQRSKAESCGQRARGKAPQRSARSVSFSQIDPLTSQGGAVPLQPKDQDHSLRLLQRLRQALSPLPSDEWQTSQEYESLQDELLRLGEHIAQQKNQHTTAAWDDKVLLCHYTADQAAESLPYRTIKIVPHEPIGIEKLDESPADLSRYRRPAAKNAPAPVRNLTLVTPETPAKPELPKLPIDGAGQLGQATARLTQQSLETSHAGGTQPSIRPELALSLLDS